MPICAFKYGLKKIFLFNFSEPNFEHEFNHFLRGREGILPGQPTIHLPGLNPDQLEGATALSKLPAFKNLQKNLDNIEVWYITLHIHTYMDKKNLPCFSRFPL